MSLIERLIPVARAALVVHDAEKRSDLWLWEHSERVMQLAEKIALLPELADEHIDRVALAAAALFHDGGWAAQVRAGKIDRWQVLNRPTNDMQREMGASLMQEQAGMILSPETLARAAAAIRECNDRTTTLAEAQVLAEAENLDEVGPLYLLRQFRQYQADGRSLEQLLTSWSTQKTYRYWDARLNDSLRFESTRTLARRRLEACDAFIAALTRDASGEDLSELLAAAAATA